MPTLLKAQNGLENAPENEHGAAGGIQ